MTKQELRKIYQEKRIALDEHEKTRLDDLILIQFQQFDLPFIHSLLTYWPIREKKEVNTFLMSDYLVFKNPGMSTCFPRIFESVGGMEAIIINDQTDYELNQYGIAEPVDGEILQQDAIDMIFVPLVIFDDKGHRVGYGKGYYDRFLSGCRSDALRIGFSYFDPVAEITDIGPFDIHLNYCITPQRVYEFG